MSKMFSSLSFFLALMLSLQNVSATQDRFEYRMEVDDTKGFVAVQHYKNAPYPAPDIPFGEEVFTPAIGTLDIEGKTHPTKFFGGWFFIKFNKENLDAAPLLLTTLMSFSKKTATPLLQTIANASCQLRKACEKKNLCNPYAGNSLSKYYGRGGIPVDGEFVPTATIFDKSTIRLVRSLAAVYGGNLAKSNSGSLVFTHGNYFLSSYCKMISSCRNNGTFLKGSFRETDDGKIANNSLRITSFESWFEKTPPAK